MAESIVAFEAKTGRRIARIHLRTVDLTCSDDVSQRVEHRVFLELADE